MNRTALCAVCVGLIMMGAFGRERKVVMTVEGGDAEEVAFIRKNAKGYAANGHPVSYVEKPGGGLRITVTDPNGAEIYSGGRSRRSRRRSRARSLQTSRRLRRSWIPSRRRRRFSPRTSRRILLPTTRAWRYAISAGTSPHGLRSARRTRPTLSALRPIPKRSRPRRPGSRPRRSGASSPRDGAGPSSRRAHACRQASFASAGASGGVSGDVSFRVPAEARSSGPVRARVSSPPTCPLGGCESRTTFDVLFVFCPPGPPPRMKDSSRSSSYTEACSIRSLILAIVSGVIMSRLLVCRSRIV